MVLPNQNFPEEKPIYVLPQHKSRVVIPTIISLLVLGIIFYLGIHLNLSLLDLTATEETLVRIISLILLLVIIIVGIILSFRHANQLYLFYRQRLSFNKKEIYYTTISNITFQQNFLDKIFQTYSLELGEKFVLRNISREIQLQDYIEQLRAYAQENH